MTQAKRSAKSRTRMFAPGLTSALGGEFFYTPTVKTPKKPPPITATGDRIHADECGCTCTIFAPYFRSTRATLCATHAAGGKAAREALVDRARSVTNSPA